jgi:hypothetical protein
MSVSPDLLFQNFTVAQSNEQPFPNTIASAATISPTQRFTFLTGTTQVATIVVPTSGYCEVVLCFTDNSPGAFSTGGNIKTAYQPIVNRPITLCYDNSSNKWWVMAVV